ncbi:MAG: MarP family serine protease [Actinomycetota bacterium]|nr:MarP family serine protease [Actinomycetota bacterium]
MNLADLFVFLLAILLAWRGYRRGGLRQIFEFGGGFLGLIAGAALGPRLVREYTDRAGLEAALLSLLVVFIALSIGQIIGYFIGARFGAFARKIRLGKADAVLGAVLGVAAALIAYWLIGSLLVLGPSQAVSRQLAESKVLRWANDVRRPPDLLAVLQQYLDTSGFPQVFIGIPPQIGDDVDLPSNKLAQKAVAAARDSTLRIVVPACGGTQLGTGWVSAPETVVTNAHVVAGSSGVNVEAEGEVGTGGLEGQVVLFDPRLDLAILKVPDLQASPLPLITRNLDSGSPGATLGYPGVEQGRFEANAAAVQNVFDARGRDIYGDEEVLREIYELRARVQQGDSGGPFVTPQGKVAGVIFAASTTQGGTGYALTGSEVQDEIERGATLSQEVATGRCTH